VIDAYLGYFERRLGQVGVGGRDAARLLAETRDHLLEAAQRSGAAAAVSSFGDPLELARQAAAELGTTRTRIATLRGFSALAVAGAAYAALFLMLPFAGSPDIAGGSVPGLGAAAFAGVVFFPQLAFVAGFLALVRVLRLRSGGAQPGAELRVQRARLCAALGAGTLTFVSLAVVALDFRGDLAPWWTAATLGTGVPLALLFTALLVSCLRPPRLWAPAGDPAGDATADLDAVLAAVPLLRAAPHPRTAGQLLAAVTAVSAAGVALAGAVAGDPFDGLQRAAFEATAVLVCFAALGRRLALR